MHLQESVYQNIEKNLHILTIFATGGKYHSNINTFTRGDLSLMGILKA